MKLVFLSILCVLICSCGMVDRTIAHITGYDEICIQNVTYLQFASGATVKVDLQGKPIQCK